MPGERDPAQLHPCSPSWGHHATLGHCHLLAVTQVGNASAFWGQHSSCSAGTGVPRSSQHCHWQGAAHSAVTAPQQPVLLPDWLLPLQHPSLHSWEQFLLPGSNRSPLQQAWSTSPQEQPPSHAALGAGQPPPAPLPQPGGSSGGLTGTPQPERPELPAPWGSAALLLLPRRAPLAAPAPAKLQPRQTSSRSSAAPKRQSQRNSAWKLAGAGAGGPGCELSLRHDGRVRG